MKHLCCACNKQFIRIAKLKLNTLANLQLLIITVLKTILIATASKQMSASTKQNANALIPTIAFNTFKGGTGKTTTIFNLGYYLASRGKRVILVDADAQRNLSQVFLDDFETNAALRLQNPTPGQGPYLNIGESLNEVTKNRQLEPPDVEVITHSQEDNLGLLPGSISITDYESQLTQAIGQQNEIFSRVPGAFYHLVQSVAKKFGADVVLIDTNPSMGDLNMMIVMFSTYFVLPCQADFFSRQAVRTLIDRLPQWINSREALIKVANHNLNPKIPLPQEPTKFLGAVVQMFTIQAGNPAAAYQRYITSIEGTVGELHQQLLLRNMAFPDDYYTGLGIPLAVERGTVIKPREPRRQYIFPEIRNFNRFAPIAQTGHVPIIGLLDHIELLQCTGTHLDTALRSLNEMTEPIRQTGQLIMKLCGQPLPEEIPLADLLENEGGIQIPLAEEVPLAGNFENEGGMQIDEGNDEPV